MKAKKAASYETAFICSLLFDKRLQFIKPCKS